jgi:AcrR family transcriptional regulator
MKTSEVQADLRVRRTHKLLWEALMALMAERAFEEITVKEICDQAMVHRTTFYKHYEDKYALLEQGMRQMYDALVAEVTMPPSAFSVDQPPPNFCSSVHPCSRTPALLQADAVWGRHWQVSEAGQGLFSRTG